MSTLSQEKSKYKKCWNLDAYRYNSPGEKMVKMFKQMTKHRSGTLIDIGCGTGRAGATFAGLGFDVTLSDFVPNCLDEPVKEMELEWLDLNVYGKWPDRKWDWGYSCDMMEHLPPGRVDISLKRIFEHCSEVFLSICFVQDHFGKQIGQTLHLTVEPFEWWRDRIYEQGVTLVNARDLIGSGVFRVRT